MYFVNGKEKVVQLIAGSGDVTKGDLVVISSGTVVRATDPISAGTLVGIALESKVATNLVMVEVASEGAVIHAEYTGSSKTSLADADIGKVFDLSDAHTVDLDDTTGGSALCVGYDNDSKEIFFVVPLAQLYL